MYREDLHFGLKIVFIARATYIRTPEINDNNLELGQILVFKSLDDNIPRMYIPVLQGNHETS